MRHLIFILLLIPFILKAKEPKPVNLSPSLNMGLVSTMANNWRYKVGDNTDWANPYFDASSWKTFTDANLYNKEIQKKLKKSNIIWFRKKLMIDSTTTQNIVAYITQSGASEIYLDGELIYSLGKVSSNPDSIVCTNQFSVQFPFTMKIGKEQLLAVRFAITKKKLPQSQENTGYFSIGVQREDFAKKLLFIANDSLFDSNGILNLGNRNGWRFHPGDDLNWAKPEVDDSEWKFYMPSSLTEPIPDSLWNGYGWFRYRFAADSSAFMMITNLYFSTWGAAEVYLDGKLVKRYGIFSTNLQDEKLYMPYNKTFPSLVLQHADSHLLAVRYSYHKGQTFKKLLGKNAGNFGFGIGLATDNYNQLFSSQVKIAWQYFYILGTMLLLVVLLHGFLFVLFPAERSNLYISIVTFLLLLHFISSNVTLIFEVNILQLMLFDGIPYIVLFVIAASMFPLTLSSMLNQKPLLKHKLLIWLSPVFALANFILSGLIPNPILTIIFSLIIIFFSSAVLLQAWKNGQKGVWYLALGFLGLIVSAFASIFYAKYSENFKSEISLFFGYMIYAALPLGLTAFMASRFRDLYANLEQKVHDRTLALEQSLEDLKSTQTQLIQSEKMASLGELTAGIAHEIQNPLNFVNNFSEVNSELIGEMEEEIDNGNLDEAKKIAGAIRENQQKINQHGKRADSIVKGMLQHSRSSSGIKEPTDINKLADEFFRLSYHGLRAKDKSFNASLKTDFDSVVGRIKVVPEEIGRVILNLLNNAFYAVSEKKKLNPEDYEPTVSVSTQKVGDKVEIRIQDNGIGIPQKVMDKIFQPFFTTKPTGQGTGLGLSLAYDIVKTHGGELKVETKEGEGSEFVIHLPI